MYSAKIEGTATSFGTSGLLYRSNKLMYDRETNTIWHQFTGEPVIGPLVDSGIKLPFFPVALTTWGEWLEEHPDTTVLSLETGVYPPSGYPPESDPRAVYNDYFTSPGTRFPVWNRNDALETKALVLGLVVGGAQKAYSITELQQERVVNDVVAGADLVVIASSLSEAARAYERGGRTFVLPEGDAPEGLPRELFDGDGVNWLVQDDALVNGEDPSQRLKLLPSQVSFWFGWFAFYPETLVYSEEGR